MQEKTRAPDIRTTLPGSDFNHSVIENRIAMLNSGVIQNAIFSSKNLPIIATDAKGTFQIFNTSAEHMLGYAAVDLLNKSTPADIVDQQQLIARARRLSLKYGTHITSGFEALVFNAMRGKEDSFEIGCVRKDRSIFTALFSVIALRDEVDAIIGYLFQASDCTTIKQAEAHLARLQSQRKSLSTKPHSMLYIEDNPANMQLVVELIAREPGVRLLTAENGSTGITIAHAEQPEVILLDINLPDMSGFKVLDILRHDPRTKHIPVIALSANNMPMNIDSGLQAGFFRYLTKPIKLDDLMDALDAALASLQKKSPNNPKKRNIPC